MKINIEYAKEKEQIVLASKGIGSGYFDRLDYLWQKQNYKNIDVATYTFPSELKIFSILLNLS